MVDNPSKIPPTQSKRHDVTCLEATITVVDPFELIPGAENTDSRPHVMDGLDPAIGYPHQIANDAIPVSNHPMEMIGLSPVMTRWDRCARYVARATGLPTDSQVVSKGRRRVGNPAGDSFLHCYRLRADRQATARA